MISCKAKWKFNQVNKFIKENYEQIFATFFSWIVKE